MVPQIASVALYHFLRINPVTDLAGAGLPNDGLHYGTAHHVVFAKYLRFALFGINLKNVLDAVRRSRVSLLYSNKEKGGGFSLSMLQL